MVRHATSVEVIEDSVDSLTSVSVVGSILLERVLEETVDDNVVVESEGIPETAI